MGMAVIWLRHCDRELVVARSWWCRDNLQPVRKACRRLVRPADGVPMNEIGNHGDPGLAATHPQLTASPSQSLYILTPTVAPTELVVAGVCSQCIQASPFSCTYSRADDYNYNNAGVRRLSGPMTALHWLPARRRVAMSSRQS